MLILPALETFQDPQMGFRSVLVLMKLGFEMRMHYDEVLIEAIPDDPPPERYGWAKGLRPPK
jgi:hypothetical protein